MVAIKDELKFSSKEYWENTSQVVSGTFVAAAQDIVNGFSASLPEYDKEEVQVEGQFAYSVSSSDGMPIVFDTGASMSVTPRIEDFIGKPEVPTTDALYGLKGKIKIVGTGVVSWNVFDINGVTRKIKTTAHYIPEASTRLFSPQVHFQEQDGGKAVIKQDFVELTLK